MSCAGCSIDRKIAKNPRAQIKNWKKEHDSIIFLDTDGCVVDNMWAKQVGVFQPLFLDVFRLRNIEPQFRIYSEFHNLWGKSRGEDRFIALSRSLGSLLSDRTVTDTAKIKKIKEATDKYIEWVDSDKNTDLGIPSLNKYISEINPDKIILNLLKWAESVNESFKYTTIKMKPFRNVKKVLSIISEKADILVVSSTPYCDLEMWWENSGFKKYIKSISSKEAGKKKEVIKIIMKHYNNALMIGDGGKDRTAAAENGILFLGIIPGREEAIWKASLKNVFEPFFNCKYKGSGYERHNLEEFDSVLKEKGPWEFPGYNVKSEYLKMQQRRIRTYKELNLPLTGLFMY